VIHLERDEFKIQFEFVATINPELGEILLQFCSKSLTWRF